MLAVTILLIFVVLGTINAICQTKKRSKNQEGHEKPGCIFFFFRNY